MSAARLSRAFVMGLALRALAIGVLAYVISRLLATTQFYATVAVLSGLMILIAVDMVRALTRLDRSVERLAESLQSDSFDFPRLFSTATLPTIENAVANVRAQRRNQDQALEHAHALLDTVAEALFVIDEQGRVGWSNRSAHLLAGKSIDHIGEVESIGKEAAATICSIAPGTRAVIRFASGKQMHVSCSQFTAPEQPAQRLIAMLSIATELAAVESKAWSDMARVLTHEMMNSLTPIASLSESLERLYRCRSGRADEEIEAEIAAALDVIKRRSVGLINFVERYREVADLPQPAARPIHIETLLQGIERLMAATMREKRVQFQREQLSPDLLLHADSELLEQALINLLQNAIDAANEAAQPMVTLRCAREPEHFAIEISDNGRGIPQELREEIFVPFFTTKQDGSGIGLSIARYVALAHGGRLLARPNHPSGSIFCMLLPAHSP